MKGHTKIELFNAKTGKLEKTVEDNNMFTNALNSLLNDNIGGDLSDPADIFPLPEKALGGLMLLPEAETEDANNLFPHSFPTATGVYGRTDINNNSMMGVYNAERSGYSPNKESYTHIWEFPTYQGNGTIACAALTHKYATDYTAETGAYSYGTVRPYATETPLTMCMTSPTETGYYLGGKHRSSKTIAGIYNGHIYFLDANTSITPSNETPPSFKLYRSVFIETACNNIIDREMQNYVYTEIAGSSESIPFLSEEMFEEVSTISLPTAYGSHITYQPFPYENGKFLLVVSKGRELNLRAGFNEVNNWAILTNAFVDVYIVDISNNTISFIRTLNMPLYNPNTGTAEIVDSGWAERNEFDRPSSWAGSHIECVDWRLCLHPSFGYGVGATTLTRQSLYQYSGASYYNGYLIYKPVAFNNNIASYGMIVVMNIFTNEFWVVNNNRGTTYDLKQIFPGVFLMGDMAVDVDNRKTFYSSVANYNGLRINTTSGSNSLKVAQFDGISKINSRGVYSTVLNLNGKIGLSSTSDSSYNLPNAEDICRIFYSRVRNNMYLATINNLPQPITKSSEQTMRVTYTISNEV